MEKNIVDGVENITTDVKSNVVIAETTAVDRVLPPVGEAIDVFKQVSTSIRPTVSRDLDDRWLLAHSAIWQTSQSVNHVLMDIMLPYDIVSVNLNSPNIALFLQHRLWRGDIKCKLVINSSQFNVGQLIAFWYYGSSYDMNAKYRKSFYAGVQLPHVLIDACSSNDVEITIPFKSFKSCLSTMKRADDADPLAMGSFVLAVASPLSIAAGSSKAVDISLFVSFENSEFFGVIDRSLVVETYTARAEPQMLPIKNIVNLASDVMDCVYADPNRDKPPVTVQYDQVVPLAASNWASGTSDVDKLYSMRLNPLSQTPHPPGSCNVQDETLFSTIKTQLGFLTQIKWTDAHIPGNILASFSANPDNTVKDFPNIDVSGSKYYYLPPCTVLSSFNCYWRGDLKLTFDVIANASHKGALIVSYIPGATSDTTATIDNMKNSLCAVFKLDGKKRFDFTIPYISDKPWWSVSETYANSDRITLPPGMVYVSVLNRLNIMNAVSKDIRINVYLSAAPNFEVAVPIPPRYVPPYNSEVLPYDKRNLYPLPGYDKAIGMGTWRYVGEKRGVMRYGSVSDHVTQWGGNMVPFGIYEIDTGRSKVPEINVHYLYNKINGYAPLQYFCRCIVNGDRDTYTYMTGFTTLSQASDYIWTWKKSGGNDPLSDSPKFRMLTLLEDTPYYDGTLILKLRGVSDIEPQMLVDVSFDFSLASASTGDGKVIFGETFSNLVDYGRRYQPYCSVSVVSNACDKDDSNKLQCKIPIFPIGLEMIHSLDFNRQARGGIIPLLLSAYRFYRGGLRFRVVVVCDQDVTLFLQHRMDEVADSRTILKNLSADSHYNMLESGYAQTFCSTKMNPVFTFEVPFYNNGILALLQEPNFDTISEVQHYAMGYLSLGVQSVKATNVILQFYYSFADDFKPSHFIGFGPLRSIKDSVSEQTESDLDIRQNILEAPIKEEIDEVRYFNKQKLIKGVVSLMDLIPEEGLDVYVEQTSSEEEDFVEPQGFMDTMKRKLVQGAVDDVVDNKASIIEALQSFIEPFLARFTDAVSDIRGRVSTIVANLGHMLFSQDWKNLLWGTASIMEVTGIIKSKYIDKVFSILTELWNIIVDRTKLVGGKVTGMFSSDTQDYVVVSKEDVIEPQADTVLLTQEQLDSTAACFSTIVTVLVSSLDLSIRKVSTGSFFSEKKSFLDLVKNSVSTSNGLFVFFKNTLNWIYGLYKKIMYKSSGLPKIHYLLSEEGEYMEAWYQDCLDLTSKYTPAEIAGKTYLNIKLIYCAAIAEVLQRRAIVEEWSENTTHKLYVKFKALTLSMSRKILSLKYDLIKFSQMTLVRFEPFVISQDGDAGVGKSFITNALVRELLRAIEWKNEGETTMVRTPGNKYWNGLKAQPICIYDDFLAITQGEHAMSEISELITLKSSAIFNPPQAAVEDKYLRYNPKIVFLNTNSPYAQIDGLGSQDPWRRRRDVMVHVERLPEYEKMDPLEIPKEVLASFGHLKFAFRKSNLCTEDHEKYKVIAVKGENGVITGKTWLNYKEYKEELMLRFKRYDLFETNNYNSRLADELSFKVRDDDTIRELIERYSGFLGKLTDLRARKEVEALKKLNEDVGDLICPVDTEERESTRRLLTDIINQQLENGQSVDIPTKMATMGIRRSGVDCWQFKLLSIVDKCSFGAVRKRYLKMHDDIIKNAEIDETLGGAEAQGPLQWFGYKAVEPQGELEAFSPAVRVYECDCPHRYLFDNEKSFIYVSNVRKSFLALTKDQSITQFFVERYGENVFVSSQLNEALAVDTDFSGIKDMLISNPHYAVSLIKCTRGCYFDQEIRPDFRVEQMFWRTKIRNSQVQYSDLPREVRQFVTPAEIPVTEKFDPRLEVYQKCIAVLREGASRMFFGVVGTLAKMALQLFCYATSFYVMSKFVVPKVFPTPKPPSMKAPQMSVYNDFVPKAHQRQTVSRKHPSTAQMNEVTTNSLVNLVERNTFFLKVSHVDQSVALRCVGIKGYLFIMVDHYHDFIVNLYKNYEHCDIGLDLVFEGVTIPVSYADLKFVSFQNSALMCGLLPTSVGKQFKNLIKHMPDVDHTTMSADTGKLIEVHTHDTEIHETKIKRIDDVTVNPEVQEAGETYVDSVWQHTISRRGVCGSVLLSNNNVTKPLIGIHVAGIKNKNVGYCEAIVADTFVAAEEMFVAGDYKQYYFTEPDVVDGQSVIMSLPSNVEEIGSVGKEMACRPPEKSKLIKSPCFEQFTPTTHAPPILHPRDERLTDEDRFSPLLTACVFHGYIPRPFENVYFSKAASEFKSLILTAVKPLRPGTSGVCTYGETIIGNPTFGIQSMELGTSEGYPYIKYRPQGQKDKHWLIDVENLGSECVLRGFHPMLREEMDRKAALRENKIVPVTIFVDCLKDSKLPIDKITVPGKTRVFSLSPTDFTIQFRQYYLDFMASYQNARFDADHAIGMDVESLEWNEMVTLLHSNSHCIVVGDYKKFGPTLMKKCVDYCFEIIIEWYEMYYVCSETDSDVRRIMGMEISNAYHLMIDNLYKTYCGAPSGSPITTILNSMVNSLYIRTAWNKIVPDQSFDKNVKMISYGDDIIMSVKKEIVDVFNCNSIAKFFSNYDIVFTDAKKTADSDGNFVPYGSIEDSTTTFLKNTFVRHPTRKMYISCLDKQATDEISNWIMKSSSPNDVAMDACTMLVRKYYPYGRAAYEEKRKEVVKFWTLRDRQIVIPSWDMLDQEMFGQNEFNIFKMVKKKPSVS